jgi:hypothetical protein
MQMLIMKMANLRRKAPETGAHDLDVTLNSQWVVALEAPAGEDLPSHSYCAVLLQDSETSIAVV